MTGVVSHQLLEKAREAAERHEARLVYIKEGSVYSLRRGIEALSAKEEAHATG